MPNSRHTTMARFRAGSNGARTHAAPRDGRHRREKRQPNVQHVLDPTENGVSGVRRHQQVRHALHLASHGRAEQLVEIVEVAKDRAERHAAALSDLCGSRSEVSLGDEFEQGVDDQDSVSVPPKATPIALFARLEMIHGCHDMTQSAR